MLSNQFYLYYWISQCKFDFTDADDWNSVKDDADYKLIKVCSMSIKGDMEKAIEGMNRYLKGVE